jgi:RNA polymerase sigma-70 factor (ECF subfamily)
MPATARILTAGIPAAANFKRDATPRMTEVGPNADARGDDELLTLAGTGDQRAYRTLVARHLPRVLAMARRITGNAAEAEDVAQDAFLRVWQKAPDWHEGDARFSTWLYRVVVNLCVDRRRRKPMAPIEAAGDPEDPTPSAESQMADGQRDRRVKDAVAGLPERQRTALVLTYYEEMSNAAVAEVMGVSVSALESLLVRARKALRGALEQAPDAVEG